MIYIKDKLNITTLFILPLIGHPRHEYTNVISAFIKDSDMVFPTCETVTVLTKNKDYRHPQTIVVRAYGDYTILTVKIPSHFNKDIRLIIDGKYSKLSERAKHLIRSYYGSLKWDEERKKYIKTPIADILDPTEETRKMYEEELGVKLPKDCEVYYKMNIDDETFVLNDFIKMVEQGAR